jgi:PAS domain S-box-containing protein
MKNQHPHIFSKLRKKAEDLLSQKKDVEICTPLIESDLHRLVHELEVYQVELEMQNDELIQSMNEARKSLEQLNDLYDFAATIYFTLSSEGEILKINFSGAKVLGKVRSQLINSVFGVFINVESRKTFSKFLENVFATRSKQNCEVCLQIPDQKPKYLFLSACISDQFCNVTGIDITERRQLEKMAEMSRSILEILGEQADFVASTQKICNLIKNFTGVDALGIRFQKGDDFPYISSSGFSVEFLEKENSLLDCNPKGGLCRDGDGKLHLSCTCGMIISGKSNTNSPFITKRGSFLINDSLTLLGLEAKDDDRFQVRNECIQEGFLSIAILPIHAKSKVVGLLQLNAKVKDFFSHETIEILEIIADNIGEAFLRKQVEIELAESEEQYRFMFANNPQPSWIYDSTSLAFLEVNKAAIELYGFSEIEFLSMTIKDIRPIDEIPFLMNCISDLKSGASLFENVKHLKKTGEVIFVNISAHDLLQSGRKVRHIIVSDITERVEAELLNVERKKKLKQLIDNISDGVFTIQNGVILSVNNAMCTLFGYTSQELIGMPLMQLLSSDQQLPFEVFVNAHHIENDFFQVEQSCYQKELTVISVDFRLNYNHKKHLIYGIAHDVTAKTQIQNKKMLHAIIQTEEREKAHFSKELHDGIGPLLSTIKLYLQWLDKSKDGQVRKDILQKTEQVIEDALTSVKEISYKLSPHLLANHGLTPAIKGFINKLESVNSIKIDLKSNLISRLEMEIEVAFYRVLIECINNTLKYANANNIVITITEIESRLCLEYRDDGDGFNISKALLEQKGLGLFNLQNRIQTIGGSLEMVSELGNGVCYSMQVEV